jgi:class 3 adenylate cyclase
MENDALPQGAQPIERRLATILMADVANYSRMMGENEERTVQVFRGHRQVFDELLRLHRGRIFNTAGDAVLAEFPSAVEAVRCATEIQAALHTRNEHLPPEQRMSFRIGINLGDVIVQGGDLLGDGVNVAARIQSIAEPGGICISGSVYDQIQNKLTLQFKQLGERSFKNIAQPIRTFSISGTDAAPLPGVESRRRVGRKGLIAASAAAVVAVALGGGYMYRTHEAAVADEARRTAEAQRVAEAQRGAEQERKAEQERTAGQERKLEQERVAGEAAQREAKLQAELKASRDALQQAAASRKADEERRQAEATRRAAEAAAQKASEDQAKAAAAAAREKAAAQPPIAAAAPSKSGGTPAGGLDRFDGIYKGRLCNFFVEPEPKTACWNAAMKVEHGALLSTWISGNTGKPAYARGKISPQGTVELTLEGFNAKGGAAGGLMTGTWADNEINTSGAWQGGLRINARWTREP